MHVQENLASRRAFYWALAASLILHCLILFLPRFKIRVPKPPQTLDITLGPAAPKPRPPPIVARAVRAPKVVPKPKAVPPPVPKATPVPRPPVVARHSIAPVKPRPHERILALTKPHQAKPAFVVKPPVRKHPVRKRPVRKPPAVKRPSRPAPKSVKPKIRKHPVRSPTIRKRPVPKPATVKSPPPKVAPKPARPPAPPPDLAQRSLAMARQFASPAPSGTGGHGSDVLLERRPNSPPVSNFSLEMYLDSMVRKLNRSASFVGQDPRTRGVEVGSVRFRINPDGSLRRFRVLDAGDQQIEIAFIKSVVERAAPFSPFPPDIRRSVKSLAITICIMPAYSGEAGFGFTRMSSGGNC